MIVVALFFILLLIGVPVAFLILMSAAAGILAYTDIPMIVAIQQMFNGLDNFVILAVPFFIIAGNLAAKGKTSLYLIEVMSVIFGRIKGGLVVATICACAFFAAISGSSFATIVAIGSIMIPGLVKAGYPKRMALGVIAAAGSIGILIPPSAPMILICVATGASVGKQFMAGFIPGILLAAVWSIYVIIVSAKHGYGEIKKYTLKEAGRIFIKAIPALIFPVIVLGSIYSGLATPTEAAAISVVYVMFIETFLYKTIKIKELPRIFFDALVTSGTLAIIIGCAQVLNWLVTVNQIPAMIASFIEMYINNKVLFILLLNVIFLVAGCFMDLVALVVVLCPILMPALAMFGINPIHFGIIAVVCAQIGFLTPPFGLNLFVTMNVAKESLGELVKATMPYLIILFLLGLVYSFIPEISMFLPNMMPT